MHGIFKIENKNKIIMNNLFCCKFIKKKSKNSIKKNIYQAFQDLLEQNVCPQKLKNKTRADHGEMEDGKEKKVKSMCACVCVDVCDVCKRRGEEGLVEELFVLVSLKVSWYILTYWTNHI